MEKKKILRLPRAGSLARAIAESLIKARGAGKNWWFPPHGRGSRALRYLRQRGWPIEDFSPDGVGGRSAYRLDPERMARCEVR